jgi:hypothetical protein
MIGVVWCIDGVLLLTVPRWLVMQLRQTLTESPTILHWEWLAVAGGGILLFGGADLAYQPLWFLTAVGMIAKGLFLSLGPWNWRKFVLDWCLSREDVDYRFYGLLLCALAVLMFHALGLTHHVLQ